MFAEAIKNFPKQFAYQPVIENEDRWFRFSHFIVCGMGGSHLAADILNSFDPSFNIVVHKDYGLPVWPEDAAEDTLLVLSSYSGNTEEVLDSYEKAGELGLPRAVIAAGGGLLERARKDRIPLVRLPDTGIQPRFALGFSLRALLKLMGRDEVLADTNQLADLSVEEHQGAGRGLAKRLKGFVPVIYASCRNYALAYNWKIKFNETGKVPAFYNLLPEMNHNEMTGFDVKGPTKNLSSNFYFLLLKDASDHPKIQKRMDVLAKLFKDRSFRVEVLELEGQNYWLKIFSSLILADWASYYTAEQYGVEAELVPMVEEFKKLIA